MKRTQGDIALDLSDVADRANGIEPRKNKVSAICRVHSTYNKGFEYLAVFGDFKNSNCRLLSDFEAGTMFKNMESDKWYKPEEIGLYEKR